MYSRSCIPCTAKIALKYSMQLALVTVFIFLMNDILLYYSATSKNCWLLNSKISAVMFWNIQVACSLMSIVFWEFFFWCSCFLCLCSFLSNIHSFLPLTGIFLCLGRFSWGLCILFYITMHSPLVTYPSWIDKHSFVDQ